jgi:hypothetical protein
VDIDLASKKVEKTEFIKNAQNDKIENRLG